MLFDWLEVKELDEKNIPVKMGRYPHTDIEALKKLLSQGIGCAIEDIQISSWIKEKGSELKDNAGQEHITLNLAPLSGLCHIFFTKELKQTFLQLQFKDSNPPKSVLDGFWSFCTARIIQSLSHLEALRPFQLTLKRLNPQDLPIQDNDDLACLYVSISTEKFQAKFIIAFSPQLQKSWIDHWRLSPHIDQKHPLSSQKVLRLSAQVGKITLPAKLCKELQSGDWVLLEEHHFNEHIIPEKVDLYLNQKKIASGNWQSGQVELVEKSTDIFDNLN